MGFSKAKSDSTPQVATERPPIGPDDALAKLDDADPDVRRLACLALHGVSGAAPKLAAALLEEKDKEVVATLIGALGTFSGDEVVEATIPLLRSEDAVIRNGAVEILGGLPSEVEPHMRRLLADEDADMRIFALDILLALPHSDAPQWVIEVLERDEHLNVVGVALDRLRELGGTDRHDVLDLVESRFEGNAYIKFAVDQVRARSEESS